MCHMSDTLVCSTLFVENLIFDSLPTSQEEIHTSIDNDQNYPNFSRLLVTEFPLFIAPSSSPCDRVATFLDDV